ncbi:lipoprotein-releasing ABC transporter ATP-binding protein LolD [Alteromonas sp. 1_MG-2023]|uniref:lipoprotein-releasing ABC transporter ATP-binding protein LolD n=1 Tax=Alteromonas sp. 1_MG-2023 TaxID=3062669 RepID=UPI0026E26137|nr:lipoprotein-releasing ABC transporter ATP-binding protein LolD [Alteromonas sp. 1_MG-2023]MDO6476981.1 lipoprotein-releasing ABC transporter ATP-binding protein LolD [Alteromonas sp. 1_MG-2023]
MDALLACRGISKTYHDGETDTPVLSDVSLTVQTSEHVAILGSSGSGKSTLLHILGGLDKPTEGEVWFHGESMTGMKPSQLAALRNQKIGFIYQFHHLLPEFSALENAAMPLLIGGMPEKKAKQAATDMLEQVGLTHRLMHKPSALSGGERQRVAIARALVNRPALVLADEPTGNLDNKTGEQVYGLLTSLSESLGTSFVVVTHDNALAARMNRTLHIKDGLLHGEAAG